MGDAIQVAAAGFGNGEQRLGHQTLEDRREGKIRRTGNAEELIQAARHKDHFATIHVVEKTVVVATDGVAVPVNDDILRGGKADELPDIQRILQAGEASGRIRLARRLHQIREIRAALGFLSRVSFQRLGDVAAGTAVVEIALGRSEVALHESFVGPLDDHEQTQVTSIQFHERVTGARAGHLHGGEQFPPQLLAQVARVLAGVVEMNFGHPMKTLSLGELVEVQGERRFGVNGLKRPRAFQVDGDIGVSLAALAHRGLHINAFGTRLAMLLLVVAQHLHALLGNFELEARHGAGEKLAALRIVLCQCSAGPEQNHAEQPEWFHGSRECHAQSFTCGLKFQQAPSC